MTSKSNFKGSNSDNLLWTFPTSDPFTSLLMYLYPERVFTSLFGAIRGSGMSEEEVTVNESMV